MGPAYTQVLRFESKSVSSSHRISLKSQWKLEQRFHLDRTDQAEFLAVRAFHRPTGISNSQVVCICFEPLGANLEVFFNGFKITWNLIEGLATVPITGMMHSLNRVELRWRGDPQETPQLPEHFKAWLEISNGNQHEP